MCIVKNCTCEPVLTTEQPFIRWTYQSPHDCLFFPTAEARRFAALLERCAKGHNFVERRFFAYTDTIRKNGEVQLCPHVLCVSYIPDRKGISISCCKQAKSTCLEPGSQFLQLRLNSSRYGELQTALENAVDLLNRQKSVNRYVVPQPA